MDNTKTSKTSAGGVIFKKEGGNVKILLIKDNWDQWTFPKGFVEEDETYRETAIREMSEELGIDASKLKYVSDISSIEYDYIWGDILVHKKVFYYIYEWVVPQEFHLQKEEGIRSAKWVNIADLQNEIGYKEDTLPLVAKINAKFSNQKSK